MVELAEAILEPRIFIKGCNYQSQRILAARILTGKFQPAHVDLGQQAELIDRV
jgi:hypothetical protein